MDDFSRCGIFLCSDFQTTFPPPPSHRGLFREYLRERGFLDEEDRICGDDDDTPPALYTIEKNSKAQNTQFSDSTLSNCNTVLVGVKDGDAWEVWRIQSDKVQKELGQRNVWNLDRITKVGEQIDVDA